MPTPREMYPPAVVDGGLVRLVTDEKTIWVEQWNGSAWINGGATYDEVMKGPTASEATLKKFRYPPTA